MPLLLKLKKVVLRHFLELRWHSILLAIGCFFVVSWILLFISGETAITALPDFIYWIMVTASTVGYGDLSPVTPTGKLIVSFFVIPFGLGLFGMVIGHVAAFVASQWQKGVNGLKSLDYEDHILVIGWNETRTLQLLRLIQRENLTSEEKRPILLCVRAEITNPLPDEIGFVRVSSFSENSEMERTAIEKAACIIIDIQDDDITMTTALYCNSRNPKAHTIAYFTENRLGDLLKVHCPNIECMPSVGVEMMAKSAVDPGSSRLHQQLLDVDKGMTQYSVGFSGKDAVPFKKLFTEFKEKYEAILIGVLPAGANEISINPSLDSTVYPASTLYYIADERINNFDWSS